MTNCRGLTDQLRGGVLENHVQKAIWGREVCNFLGGWHCQWHGAGGNRMQGAILDGRDSLLLNECEFFEVLEVGGVVRRELSALGTSC